MSNSQICIALAALLLLFGIVGGMEMQDAQKTEALRPQLTEAKQ